MKRYQCIKNWYYLSDNSDDNLLFKMGTCYPEMDEKPYLPGNVVIRCEDGTGIQVTPDVVKTYFQELIDLHVDDAPGYQYCEMESEEYALMIPRPAALAKGCAIAIAIIITIGLIIYAAI